MAIATIAGLSFTGGASRAEDGTIALENRSTGFAAGEPTMGVLPDGSFFYQAYTRTLRSFDEGRTWQIAHQLPGAIEVTGDPYIHVDAETGVAVASQLYVACQVLSRSADRGGSWIDAPSQCATIDHQKIGSGPWPAGARNLRGAQRLFYTCVNHVLDTACATSPDDGLTWGPLSVVFPGFDPTGEQGLFTAGVCGGLEGDPVSGPDGTIYVPREYCGRPFVGVSKDAGLTWSTHYVASPAKALPVAYGGNNPAVTVADDGTVFYAWTGDDWRHHVARSADAGETWTDLGVVSPPDVLSTTFPLVIAGMPGAVATAYLGTRDTALGPDQATDTSSWHLFLTYALDGNAASPEWTTVQVTADPVMIGCIGRHGPECSDAGHGALLDFNDIELTLDGRVVMAYTDACLPPACVDAATSTSNLGLVAVQVAGPRLRDEGPGV